MIKRDVYRECTLFVNRKLSVLTRQIHELEEGLQSETKSSAGDKHETGRAMMHLEREKIGQQLAELEKLKAVLAKIDPEKKSSQASLGSIVYTDKANYFLSISAGLVNVDETSFYAISLQTPVGRLLLNRSVNDTVYFNGTPITIQKIE